MTLESEVDNQRKRIIKLENDVAYCKTMIKIWEEECHNGCKKNDRKMQRL